MRVAVVFPGYGKRYCYSAPEGTRKGDVVKVRTSGYWGRGGYWQDAKTQYVKVVGRYPNYKGPVKKVLGVYRCLAEAETLKK